MGVFAKPCLTLAKDTPMACSVKLIWNILNPETPQSPYPERIDKETLNKLPLIAYEGEVELVRDKEAAFAACEHLSKESILGFDTETRPSFKKGESFRPSLIQLAGTGRVYLFQNKLIGTIEPLKPIFSNPDILKVGVAIRDDIKGLQAIEPFSPEGFVEISTYTTPLGIINTGLRALCGIFLEGRISKRAQVSNWARHNLQPNQITYAATDAWVSRELYLKLDALGHTVLSENPDQTKA